MKLSDCLHTDLVALDLEVPDKPALLRHMAEKFAKHHPDLKTDDLYESFVEREGMGATALGEGLALPHARIELKGLASVGLVRLAKPLEWPAPDKKPVKLAIFSVVEESARQLHLQMLARLSRVLQDPDNRRALLDAETPDQALEILARPQQSTAH